MPEELDKILKDIEADKQVRLQQEEQARKMLQVDEKTASKLVEERKSKVSGFKLELPFEDEDPPLASVEKPMDAGTAVPAVNGETPAAPPFVEEAPAVESEAAFAGASEDSTTPDPINTVEVKKSQKKRNPKAKTAWGCIRGLIYAAIVLGVSGLLAFFVIAGGFDLTGLNKSDVKVPVTLTAEQCKDTAQVAKVLKEAGVIDQPLIFQLYCKFTKADGQFKPQVEASLSPDMGYETIINVLKATVREIVKVTFPEGSTIKEMAAKLEENGVCSVSDFYQAMNSDNFTYDFLNEIPVDEAHKGRFNKLEGYLFPDTYEFYVGSSGETAVRKFLDGFNARVDVSMRAAIKAKGMTLNDVITIASLIQWEAAKTEDMYGVSRVIHNRLNNAQEYPKLECDSARRYINVFMPPVNNQAMENLDYDTYKRTGLPVGAINNPGLVAIDAAMNPSESSDVMKAYFFATDMKTGETYFNDTYAKHVATCKKYKIGMYA